jgi:uncharacterized small protein (DUF1192 family)
MNDLDERPKPKPRGHEIGEDLSKLSVDELEERIGLLKGEIVRLETARAQKQSSKAVADAFFRS